MASLMSNPNAMQYMGQMGLGLLAAGQAQPPGVNRYSHLMNAYNQANQNLMRNQMFDMQREDREEKRAEKAAQKKAMSTLVGGLDPTTGITWDQGRAGMGGGEQLGLLAQAAPDAFAGEMIKSQFAAPKERPTIKGADGYNYYKDTLERVLPGVKAKGQKETWTYGNQLIDGQPRAARKSNLGSIQVQDESGTWKVSKGGGPFVGLNVQTGSVGDLTDRDRSKMVKDLTEQRTSAFQMYQMTQRLKTDIDTSGDEGISVTGAVTRLIDGVSSQASALVRTFAPGEQATPPGGTQKYIDSFDWSQAPAAESAAIRSKITSLAYAFALAKNGTRPTDEDVRNMMKIIGGGAGSVSQMNAAMHSAMQEVMDSYSLSHYEIMREKFDWAGELEARGMGGKFESKGISEMTDDELLRGLGVQ